MTRARRILALFAAAVALLAMPAAAFAGIAERVGATIGRSGISSMTSAYAWDQQTREVLYSQAANRPMIPASTMKLLTSAAAMDRLGPSHRFSTRIALDGVQNGSTFVGDVWLVGGGDPSLSTSGFARANFGGVGANIAALARPLQRRGITLVRGHVKVDDDLFDSLRVVPRWKPSFWYEETGALGALTVNESLVGSHIGSQSVRDPDIYAGDVLRAILMDRGIRVAARTEPGSLPADAKTVGAVASPTVRQLIAHMNSTSDNFFAETFIKQVGVDRFGDRGNGSTSDGARAVRAQLVELGADMSGVTIVDGSGLSYDNRVTARALGHVLGLGLQAEWGETWLSTFAVSGRSGTLKDRMTHRPYYGRVRAKTGTLNPASALAGFASRTTNGKRYGFVVLTTNPRGGALNVTTARGLQDRVAMVLVR